MEHIAHQAVVMHFIMKMTKNCKVDLRGSFHPFFQKAKEGYFEAFKNEPFKSSVRSYSQSPSFQFMTIQNHVPRSGVGSIGRFIRILTTQSKLSSVFYQYSSLQFKLST